MNGLMYQHIVNAIQIFFGGLLLVLYVSLLDYDFKLFDYVVVDKYLLILIALIFGICIFIKQRIRRKYNVEDPLTEVSVSKYLIYVSYVLFMLFIFLQKGTYGYSMIIAGLAWLVQLVALIISFFYKPIIKDSDDLIDDQMIVDDE